MTIISEVQSRKKSRRTIIIGSIIVALLLAYASYVWFFSQKRGQDLTYKTYTVSSGSVTEAISGEGKSLYRGYYDLGFPISGKIAGLDKKEGGQVRKGESIASLDSTYVRLDLKKAEIALGTARANLVAKRATAPSAEDIRISEEQLQQAILSLGTAKHQSDSDTLAAKKSMETALVNFHSSEKDLEVTRADAKISLQNSLDSVNIALIELKNAESDLARTLSDGSGSLQDLREKGFLAIDSILGILEKDLHDMDDLLGITDANRNKNDAFEPYLGAKDPYTKVRAESAFWKAKTAFDSFFVKWNRNRRDFPYAETILWMDSVYSVSGLVSDTLSDTLTMLRSSISSGGFPQTSVDAFITLFDSERFALKSQNDIFITARQAIAAKETSLATEEEARRDIIDMLVSRLDLAKSTLEKTKSNATLLLAASQSKLDIAQKQVESSKLQYSAVVKQGKDNVASASKQVDIARALFDAKRKGISPEELAPYEIAIRTAENAVEEAKQRLKDTVLKSPTDGIITKIDALIGEEISAGKPLISVVDTTHPYIESQMEEIDIAKVYLGQMVYITFDALEGVSLTGSVTFISPSSSIDANGIVTYRVDIAFEPGSAGVREGMSATVEYIVREAKNVLVVPSGVLTEIEGIYSLFSLDRNSSVPVEIGISDGKMTEVKSGVRVGEKVKE